MLIRKTNLHQQGLFVCWGYSHFSYRSNYLSVGNSGWLAGPMFAKSGEPRREFGNFSPRSHSAADEYKNYIHARSPSSYSQES